MNSNEQLTEMLDKTIQQIKDTNNLFVKDNEFLKDIIIEKEKNKRIPWIFSGIIIALLCATFLIMHFKTLNFFSEYEFYYEEIRQDTGEGSGNNVYFPGENATYNQNPSKEDIINE